MRGFGGRKGKSAIRQRRERLGGELLFFADDKVLMADLKEKLQNLVSESGKV